MHKFDSCNSLHTRTFFFSKQGFPDSVHTKDKQLQSDNKSHICDEETFKCEICGLHFHKSYNLKRHVSIIHRNEKLFQCNHCEKHFSALSNLKRHERVHTGEKPYVCKTCEKSFSRSGNLKKHEQIH